MVEGFEGDMITDFHIDERLKHRYYEQGYWRNFTLCDVWRQQSDMYADKEYVRDEMHAYTYGEVDQKAGCLAAWLISKGIGNGDVVSFQLPIWSEFCIAYVAILKVGAVCHPLPRNFNEEDLLRAMNLVESAAFICPTTNHHIDYEQQILNIQESIPSLKAVVLLDREASCKKQPCRMEFHHAKRRCLADFSKRSETRRYRLHPFHIRYNRNPKSLFCSPITISCFLSVLWCGRLR